MKKLKITNPKLLSFILANAIFLSQTGCSKQEVLSTAKVEKTQKTSLDNPSKLKQVELFKSPIFLQPNQTELSKQDDVFTIEQKKSELKPRHVVVTNNQVLALRKKADEGSKLIGKLEPFQKLVKLDTSLDGWTYVKYQKKRGYVKSDQIQKVGNTYIDVDIAKQRLTYYKKGKKFLSTDVVTGKDSTPTVTGLFPIYEKRTDYNMVGADYVSHADYVLKFYKGYYIHDASWRSSYGGTIYHASGSHGCVNTPYKKVKKLYNNTEVNTKVFVHK